MEEHQKFSDHEQGFTLANVTLNWEQIFDCFQDAIWVLDQNQRIVLSNKTAEAMFGFSRSEMSGKHCWEIVHGTSEPVPNCPLLRVVKKHCREEIDLQIGLKWFNVSVDPIFDSRGQITSFIHNVRDITERKHLEEALKTSMALLVRGQEVAQIGTWTFNLKTGKISWSDQMYHLFGLDPKNGPPSWPDDTEKLYHPDDWKWVFPLITESIEKGQSYDVDDRYFKTDGTLCWAHVTGKSFPGPDGKPELYIGTMEDITERKKREEELQKAQKLEALGRMAGGIAHDFNNLMGGVFGYIDIALEEKMSSKAKMQLEKACKTIDRARSLTGQLITFSKGGEPIKAIEQLNEFIQESVEFALSGSNVLPVFNIPEEIWPCEIDKNQINQTIHNIVLNAQQSLPDGGKIQVNVENTVVDKTSNPSLAPGKYVKVTISDTGIGMPKDILNRIFDPFFSTKAKGHGLGLSICHSIIHRHGGTIDVESEPGKGSTFSFFLPASPDKAAIMSITKTSKLHTGSGTFLIMDDENDVLDTLSSMLESFGYTVVCKTNGQDAIDFFEIELKECRKLAGMILDLTVPGGMGGKEMMSKIRGKTAGIPVFVASGYTDDSVMTNPVNYGFIASICKPFRKIELSELMNKHMKLTE